MTFRPSPLHPSWRCLALLVAVLLCCARPELRAALSAGHSEAVQAATGLLVTSTSTSTVFCVSSSGLFVTSKQLLSSRQSTGLSIVMSPGEKDEKTYPATIVRTIPNTGLLILKAAVDHPIPALKIGDATKLAAATSISGAGYPLQSELSIKTRGYQEIAFWSGTVNSFTKKKGVLSGMDFTGPVQGGFIGGPILNVDGEVVGIVSSLGQSVHFALPATILQEALDSPIIQVTADPAKPADLLVSLDWLTPPAAEPKVSVEIDNGDWGKRIVPARKSRTGKYRAETGPSTDPNVRPTLQIALEFEGEKLEGTISDRDITVAGAVKPLREIHEIQRVANSTDFSVDGKPPEKLPELKNLRVEVEGRARQVDGQKASRIVLRAPSTEPPSPAAVNAVVKLADGREFSSTAQAAAFPKAETTVASPAASRLTPPAPPVHHEIVPPPPILSGKVDLPDVREFALPQPVNKVVSAQDGRSLLLYMKDARKTAVFDVIDLKIRGFIEVGDDNALIAGGARSVVVVCRGTNVIERFSLATLEKEKTIANPFGEVVGLVMGRSSPSLAMILARTNSSSEPGVMAFDTEKMSSVATLDPSVSRSLLDTTGNVARISADGRTIGLCHLSSSPTGFVVLSYRDGAFEKNYAHQTFGILVPNADGSQIFTAQSGIFTNQHLPVLPSQGNWFEGTTFLPSYHPMFFFSVPYTDQEERKRKNQPPPRTVAIYTTGNTQPLFQCPADFKEMLAFKKPAGRSFDPISLDERYHFFPQLDLFLTIPPTNDKIIARPFNLRQMLDAKGIDYLYVTSIPPTGKAATPYHYKIEATAKAGNLTFALQSGPPGLTVGNDGNVVWTPPGKPVDQAVVVAVKSSSGQEQLYSFHIVTTQ